MLKNRGKILKDKLHKYSAESGISLTKIAQKAGYDQSMLYRHFQKENLSAHIVFKYGKAIDYDFTRELPELEDEFFVGNEKDELKKCQEEVRTWKEKYMELLERHNSLLTKKLKGK